MPSVPQHRRRWRRPWLPFRPIVGGFFLAAAALAALAAWALVDRLGWPVLVAYLLAVNLVTFAAYAYDKAVAGGEGGWWWWRVPEPVLHGLALGGGTPAAFAGQKLLRHKTLKQPFRRRFWATAVLQLVCLCLWLYYAGV